MKNRTLSLSIILTLIFLTLKLGEFGVVSDWNWIWIFSPLWIYVSGISVVYILFIIMATIVAMFQHQEAKEIKTRIKSDFELKLEDLINKKK